MSVDAHDEPPGEAAPGWDAIDAAMARLYGDATPRHVGFIPPAAFSNNLQGCSAYAAAGHWHYVSYGLSELYQPAEDDDRTVSGWGFELTMRVRRETEGQAPSWPFEMLNRLANHVNGNAVLLLPGDRIDMRSPVTGHPDVQGAPPTRLSVYAVTTDPQLGEISTPNGRLEFLQVVGVTAAEKEQMVATSTGVVLAALAVTNPLLLTDPARA